MISKRANLILVVIISVWLLAGWSYFDLTPSRTMTASAEHLEPSYLVVITFDNQNDLQRLATLELDLLDLQENATVAIVTSPELTILYNMGFDVRILDAPATPEHLPHLVVHGLSPVGERTEEPRQCPTVY